MKLVSNLALAAIPLALAPTFEGRSSNYYAVTALQDIQDGSNYPAVPVADLLSNNIYAGNTPTSLKSTKIVPSGTKTYVAGLRATAGGNNKCSASLISPTHILGGTYCTQGTRWASIGSHYVNGTQDGEQIKIIAILNHPKSSNANFSDDLAIFVLEKPSSFKPVTLGASDESDAIDEDVATKMGWFVAEGEDTLPYELTRRDVQLVSNEKCLEETIVDDTQFCSRGVANETSCRGDYGGPVVIEHPGGDVLVGMMSWGDDCERNDYPSIYSRVSSARAWILSVVSGVCFH